MSETRRPSRILSISDAVVIIIGVVVGAGIFRTPSIVAGSAGSEGGLFLVWIAGGLISLAGALCYCELTSTFPGEGGEYRYLTRAFGAAPGFLFAWARLTVIQTGSIAMLAFLIGDYVSDMMRRPSSGSAAIAALTVVLMTSINVLGIRQGKWTQWLLVGTLSAGLVGVIAIGALSQAPAPPEASPVEFLPGRAMIFVLLTFGGWNEAAYLSAEVRSPRSMVRALTLSIFLITLLYLAVNFALLEGLGLIGMAESEAVAADLMRASLGEDGARFISVLVIVAALSTMNATMITGARTVYALGRDFPRLKFLGRWRQEGETPANALVAQGVIALLLVGAGSWMRSGFEAMVEYTAPVFWFFFFLVGISLLVLRRREPGRGRPFHVPLYPWLPLFFCAVCIAMVVSSLIFSGAGAVAGLVVLLSGIPVFMLLRRPPPDLLTRGEPS